MSKRKNLITDYLGYIIIKIFSRTIVSLPLSWGLAIGRFLGRMAYIISGRRRRISLSNLRMALAKDYTPRDLRYINRRIFENLGMNLIELLRFPWMDEKFIKQFMRLEGWERVDEAFEQGKGLIFLTGHFGNWELSAQVVVIFGYPMQVLAREQKHSKLNELLNAYRSNKGAEVIAKGMAVRQILRHLRNNCSLGMLADQDAGRKGILVEFFGRLASTPVGPVEIALRTGAVVLPSVIIREDTKFHRLKILPPLKIEDTGNRLKDIKSALEQYNRILESCIRQYPHQWLWVHKRWKSSPQRKIVILSDGKAGHLRQAQGVAELLEDLLYERAKQNWSDTEIDYRQRQDIVQSQIVKVEFRNKTSKFLSGWLTRLAGYRPGLHIDILKFFLTESSYRDIAHAYGDFVISCGSDCEIAAYLLATENNARAIHILKPAYLPEGWFSLCLIPWHDKPRTGRHILTTLIAPSPVTLQRISAQAEKLKKKINLDENRPVISVFIGGNTEGYELTKTLTSKLCQHLKMVAVDLNTQLLITTSRRTPLVSEQVLSEEFGRYEPCKLLIIANQANMEGAVEGMLGLADTVVVTEDSVSMISEAVGSGRDVVVLSDIRQSSTKQQIMVERLVREGYISIANVEGLVQTIKDLLDHRPTRILNEREKIKDRLKVLL